MPAAIADWILPMTLASVKADYGSFKDSLKAPIHRWFTYPAGYSHKLVESAFRRYAVTTGDLVADPFLGTGTTSVTAKFNGIDSIGFEPHPYVCSVANTKLTTDLDTNHIWSEMCEIVDRAESGTAPRLDEMAFPELVYKCFTIPVLAKLTAIRDAINENPDRDTSNFLNLALAKTLRQVTTAGAGWPYIAPSKYAKRVVQRDPIAEFERAASAMIDDLRFLQTLNPPNSQHTVVNAGAAEMENYIEPESVDLIVTSPPYLNNYDYADRTRLETYFLGIYNSWSDITHNVRRKLMVSATTQITTGPMAHLTSLPEISISLPETYEYLAPRINRLTNIRTQKPGRKTYDIMVAGYFEDMLPIMRACHAVLKPGGTCVMVIGDSAPYGVHVETEHAVGMMALEVGFSDFAVEVIRERGTKWQGNTQRHSVPLKESILTIAK